MDGQKKMSRFVSRFVHAGNAFAHKDQDLSTDNECGGLQAVRDGDVAGKWWESVQGGQDEPRVLNKLQQEHE